MTKTKAELVVELSQAEVDALDRADKMYRRNAAEKAEQDAQAARVAITNRAQSMGDTHYTLEDAKRNPPTKYITPPTEVRPAMGKPYSDVEAYCLNEAQRKLYGLPTAPVAPTPSITLKTQPGVQHPRRGDTYSDVYEDAAEASRRAAELSVRPTPSVPTKECLNCGEQIAKSSAWHRKADDTACVLPGEEAFALRDAGVRQGQQLPGTK